MNVTKTKLYMTDNTGKIREWSIGVEDWTIIIEHGEKDGAMQRVTEEVPEGKATRTREDQIMSRLASRISKQRDKGYRPKITGKKATNIMGLKKPMLATPSKNVRGVDLAGAYLQHKYDGNRCLISNQDGEIICYTRNGKRIDTIEHITEGLDIPNGSTLDGELYSHGVPLQTIVSWIKRKQASTSNIRYHVYDIITDHPYSKRYALLNMISEGFTPAMELVPTEEAVDWEHVQKHFKESREQGYEGSIVRLHTKGYEDGKRSKSLIKVKSWEDDYFPIVDIIPSKDGWARLVCEVPGVGQFRVTSPGPVSHKYYIIENKDKYIGHLARVEFAYYTKDGLPFHPVCTLIDDGII